MNLLERNKFPFAFTWLVFAAILALTLLPAPPAPEEAQLIPHLDKIVHFTMFGGFAAVWWWEYSLYRGYSGARWSDLWPIAVSVAALAAADEIMQGALTTDRSADVLDWVADALGSVIFPSVSRPIINRLLPEKAVRLYDTKRCSEITADLEQLYHASFPPEERREWKNIVEKSACSSHPLRFTLITVDGRPTGFISWWKFSNFRYVEHFAVSADMRGNGIGASAIRRFVKRSADPVVLEVEPPTHSGMAERRIRFYQRCGFTAHPEYEYVQPPYADGLPPVRLMLMTSTAAADLRAIDRTLKVMVYDTNPDFQP